MAFRLHRSLALVGLLLGPTHVHAFDCDFYRECCYQLVDAYRESGATPAQLRAFSDACELPDVFAAMPGAQHMFCLDAWEAMSRSAYDHFQSGQIGFYPDSCMAGVDEDPDEILEPDPAFPEPDPEVELELLD